MATRTTSYVVHAADISFVRDQVTSCESGFLNTTSKHDAMANVSRYATFVRPAGSSHGGFMVRVATDQEQAEAQ